MYLTPSNLELVRTRGQQTELYLSVFQPRIVLQCQVNNAAIANGARTISFDTVTTGSASAVEAGMPLWVGSAVGLKDIGCTRIKSIMSGTMIVVAENADIQWADNQYLTAYRFFDVLPVYPRIIQNPANAEQVIFYKDYDTAYANQNSALGAFVNMGSHRAMFLAGGSAGIWYMASGTTAMQTGISLSYDWAFEGGTPSGSTSQNPGLVNYTAPGQYVTRLIVSGSNGAVEKGYRYASIYNPIASGTALPYQKWSLDMLDGSRDSGGYTASITIYETSTPIEEGSVVVVFSKDMYGSTEISLGGNQENNSSTFFVGYVLDGTVEYDYEKSVVKFDLGSITQYIQKMMGFAISVESKNSPATWFELKDMDMRSAIYHFLKWHSTVLTTTDVSYLGDNPRVQFFDSDRSSVYDAVDNFMRSAIVGKAVADRQGKVWIEPDITTATGTVPSVMQITNRDWRNAPVVDELLVPDVSYLERGGIAYSGPQTGSFSANMACSPGDTPGYRGEIDQAQGLALFSQAHLNRIVGNLYAWRNTRFKTIDMDLAGSYRNLDIAPQEPVGILVRDTDTKRGFTIDGQFNPNSLSWSYDSQNKMLLARASFIPIVNGNNVQTMIIPAVPVDGGFGQPAVSIPPIPPFVFPTGTYGFGATYTWVLKTPAIGGIPGPRLRSLHTATRIDAYCVGGTSVTFNVEVRSVIATPGINLVAADLVAPTSGTSTTVFSNAVLPADYYMWLDISGVSGGVTEFTVTVAT